MEAGPQDEGRGSQWQQQQQAEDPLLLLLPLLPAPPSSHTAMAEAVSGEAAAAER